MKRSYLTDIRVKIKRKMKTVPDYNDAIYNHALRCVLQLLDERSHEIYAKDSSIDEIISWIVDKYLYQDPESNEEFKFNEGINDAIDIIRSFKLSWR